jgi:rhodanese-related sulfurtransferase
MLVSSGASSFALSENNQTADMAASRPQTMPFNITNISVQEAYDKLTNTAEIEIPIDVRWIHEWYPQRIDTPIPEHPRWFVWDLIKSDNISKFLYQYDGCNVIFYCKGGYRSWKAARDVFLAGFNGKIYNMLGGITAWNNAALPTAPGGIYNITVNDTMLLCSDILNGKQKPVDVRTWAEWITGFIDTPWPESPIWYILDNLKDDSIRRVFMNESIGEELIIYCKGGYRSLIGAFELYYDNFTGTLYNMLGGITEWQKYHPIRNNTPPATPSITGEEKPKVNVSYDYTFTANDAEGDGICFYIDWGDGNTEWTEISDEYSVIVSHAFMEKKTEYNITSYAKDFYDNESGVGYLKIKTPKSYAFGFHSTLLEWILERFPRAFPILRQLL